MYFGAGLPCDCCHQMRMRSDPVSRSCSQRTSAYHNEDFIVYPSIHLSIHNSQEYAPSAVLSVGAAVAQEVALGRY